MADNTQLNAASTSGDVLRTEDRTSYKTPVTLIDVGGVASESILGDSGVTLPVGGLAAENAAAAGNPLLVGGRYDATPRTLGDADVGAIALDADGAVHVSDGGNTLTVDGTVAATQSGSWSITDISGTVSLPTGAATAAKQPALGTAGTASADVITVQGVASMTPVQVADNGGSLTVDNATLSVTGGGNEASALRVTIANNSTGVLSVDDNGSTLSVDDGGGSLTVDGTVAISGTVTVGSHAVTNAGTFAVQVDGAALTSLQLLDDVVATDGSAALTKGYQVCGTDGTNAQIISTNTSGHVNIADGGGSITVDGTVAISGTVTVGSHAVTNAGTFAVQVDGSALTALQLLDDVVATDGAAALTKGYQVCGTDGTNAQIISVTSAGLVNVADGGGTLTVDNATLSVTGGGVEASALRVTIASDSTGVLSVDDNGSTISVDDGNGSLTIDGSVGVTGAALTALQLLDDVVATDGSAALTKGYQVCGTDGTNAQILSVTTGGLLNVNATMNGTWDITNAGTFVVQENGAALTALQLIDDIVFSDDAAFTPASSRVAAVGFFCDDASTDSVNEGDIGAARMTADRKQIATLQPHTAGGLSISRTISGASTNATSVKASAGQVYGWYVSNINASPAYLKLYNKASSPTVGTDTPVLTLCIPGNTAGVAGHVEFANGIEFSTGIALAITTGATDGNTSAVAASEVIINLLYK